MKIFQVYPCSILEIVQKKNQISQILFFIKLRRRKNACTVEIEKLDKTLPQIPQAKNINERSIKITIYKVETAVEKSH